MKEFYHATRADLHKIPEGAFAEYKTAEYIRKFLKGLEIDYHEIGTSTVAFIPGETDNWIAFRADIDALPMAEENNTEYKSQHEGYMHACGHDAHTTNLLYFAKWLKENVNSGMRLKKSVMLIFQAAEEKDGGAKFIASDPVFKDRNVEAIMALHVYPGFDQGTVMTVPGAITFGSISLGITVNGKGCHGAEAHKGIDSILVSAKLVEAYQSIVSRNVEPDEPMVLTIGSFHAGTAENIIPEKVEIRGTIRVVNNKLALFIKKRIEEINHGFEVAFGVKIDMKYDFNYPAVVNNQKLVDIFEKVVPSDKRVPGFRLSGSEDFSFYSLNGVPGLLFFLGTRNESKGFTHFLHNSKFDLDPEALTLGFEVFRDMLKDLGGI